MDFLFDFRHDSIHIHGEAADVGLRCLFEAMSGFTTTGATVMDSISHLSHGIVMWRSLMQWIGGMGIILLPWL